MKKTMGIVCVWFIIVSVFAQTMHEDLQKAIQLHDSAESATGEMSKEKVLACQKLLQPYIEKDAVCRAYYGSAVTMEASLYATSNPMKALDLLDKGSGFIDSAVQMDGDNYVLRFLRLANGIEISRQSPLRRYSVIKNDVKWFEQNGIDYSKDENATLYYNIALYYLAANDLDAALDALDNCIATKSSDPVVKQAQDVLRRYEE